MCRLRKALLRIARIAVFVATSEVGNRVKKLIERADLGDTLAAFERGYEQMFAKVAITSGCWNAPV